MKFPRLWGKRPKKPQLDWRAEISRPASLLEVGGFRPSNQLTASCFGEVRAMRRGDIWPEKNGAPLWPVCQLNLRDAPQVPANLRDIALLQFFVAEDWYCSNHTTYDETQPQGCAFALRSYDCLDGLIAVTPPEHGSTFRPFEAKWNSSPVTDYPTHDTLPLDFPALGIGEYYDQEGIVVAEGTKIGGWPYCIQSEPWWDYREEGRDFEYALQIGSEEKSNCIWGDAGAIYIARHQHNRSLWAIEGQFF